VWINTLPQYPQDYELLNSLPTDDYLKTLIALPIKDIGSPVGALALLSSQKLEIDKDLELLITNLANLSVMRFKTDSVHESLIRLVKDQKTPVDTALLSNLTIRQRKIFKLMIEKKTNKEIAAQIGYSTSTIKQETSAIYEILGIRGREDSYLFNEKP
jgi:DNA-binding CsgD family transcriptional regulator